MTMILYSPTPNVEPIIITYDEGGDPDYIVHIDMNDCLLDEHDHLWMREHVWDAIYYGAPIPTEDEEKGRLYIMPILKSSGGVRSPFRISQLHNITHPAIKRELSGKLVRGVFSSQI